MKSQGHPRERGQVSIFFALAAVALMLVAIGGIEVARFVYAVGEVQKAADAAALAAAQMVDVVAFRETGTVAFTGDVYGTAVTVATMNTQYLNARHIGAGVTAIWADAASQRVYVTVVADLSPIAPRLFPADQAITTRTGWAKFRLQATAGP